MKSVASVLAVLTLCGTAHAGAPDPEYVDAIQQWRDRAERNLRADNGWLTLAGRYVMKPGTNRIGTAKENDIVFPPNVGPAHLGSIEIGVDGVMLRLAPGITMASDGKPFSGEREMRTALDKRDWVSLGRFAMHVIARDGNYILRLADNEGAVRKGFAGRVWYDVDDAFRVDAKFIPYPAGKTVAIVNVIDEISNEPSPGYVEFTLGGKTARLDAVGEDGGLFFVFRDQTAGKTTYAPGRFLYVEKVPAAGAIFSLDFNKAYNPPCAFSDYTTCPLPPEQNKLELRVEAGEKYRPKKL